MSVAKIKSTVTDYHHGLVTMRVESTGLATLGRSIRILVHGNVIEASKDDLIDLFRVLDAYFKETTE